MPQAGLDDPPVTIHVSVCTACDRRLAEGGGTCEACGAVALRPLDDPAPPSPYRTPFVRSRLENDLYLKVEGAAPTGTFKDRMMAQLADEAMAAGARGAVVASSGNAAAAAAAACRQRGLPLLVIVPRATPTSKLVPIHLREVPVIRFGNDPSQAYALARRLAHRFDLAELASTMHLPAAEQSCRNIGYEVVEQLGAAPAAVAAPLSIGPALVGTGRGIEERTGVRPALLGGQAAGCAPIARAFSAGDEEVTPWDEPVTTEAGSIADRVEGYAHEATSTLQLVRRSGGYVHAYGDDQLHDLRRRLLAVDGVDVELSSVTGLCAALDWTGPGPTVVVLTGAGWRDTLALVDAPPVPLGTYADAVGEPELVGRLNEWTGTELHDET